MNDQFTNGSEWLRQFIAEAVRNKLCTRIHCTTCGAVEFRTELVKATAMATGQQRVSFASNSTALAVAQALAHVRPVAGQERELESAVRFVLFSLWDAVGELSAERYLEPAFSGTWAGEILARMKSYHKARQEAVQEHRERSDPVKLQQRREEKRRAKQQDHAARLEKKKERDRIWREKQEKTRP